jgi:CDP-diacylglycerol--glycerol-3-phosphate 3-phosphatidyltransferase
MTLFSSIDHFLYALIGRFLPLWITPNHITVFRFVTIPFVIYFLATEMYVVAIPLFIISAFSDAVDGALARMSDRVTDWGKIFDPLADKLLIGSAAAITVTKFLGFWFVATIISIELFLIAVAWYKRYGQKKTIEAGKLGKTKMVLQSVGVGLLLVYAVAPFILIINIAQVLLVAAIICAIGSIFTYNSI